MIANAGPQVRITVAGQPTAEELAAVLAVLRSRPMPAADEPPLGFTPWRASALPSTPGASRGGWRQSALPR